MWSQRELEAHATCVKVWRLVRGVTPQQFANCVGCSVSDAAQVWAELGVCELVLRSAESVESERARGGQVE